MSDAVLARLRAAVDPSVLTEEIEDRYRSDWLVTAPPEVRPLALARPRTTADVSALLAVCHDTGTPVVPQGGLTGLTGAAVPIDGALLISLERMRAVEQVDPVAATITVEAGAPLQAVQAAAEAAGLLFPLDIGARGSCQIGGNVATNAGGNRVLRWGMARALVLGMEVVLADGTVLSSLNKMLKNNAGYDLKQVFIGSEGTLGIITRLVLRLFPAPRSVSVALAACDDFGQVHALLARARSMLAADLSAFEVMWPGFYDRAIDLDGHRAPLGRGHAAYVLIEQMGSDPEGDPERFGRFVEAAWQAGELADAVVAQNRGEADRLWAIRDMSGEIATRLAPIGNFDVSIETARIDDFLGDVTRRYRARWPDAEVLGFGHLADSNLHVVMTTAERPFPHQAVDALLYEAVGEWGGSISAEHGIGTVKRPYLARSRTMEEIATMRLMKRALDPRGILNPGRVFAD